MKERRWRKGVETWGTVRTLKQGIVGAEKMRLGERVKQVGVKNLKARPRRWGS